MVSCFLLSGPLFKQKNSVRNWADKALTKQ